MFVQDSEELQFTAGDIKEHAQVQCYVCILREPEKALNSQC